MFDRYTKFVPLKFVCCLKLKNCDIHIDKRCVLVTSVISHICKNNMDAKTFN